MLNDISAVIQKADQIVKRCGTRNPYKIAAALDIEILPCRFKLQKGAYKVILKNRFIFIKDNLDRVTERIVLLHEIGHDVLHRQYAASHGGFEEYSLFNTQDSRMEYEANAFAAQVSLPDGEILEYIKQGCDTHQIAAAMGTDINLIALKADNLISQGYLLRKQEHSSNFLRYNK